jgi:formate hydrogenlyase subunit 4
MKVSLESLFGTEMEMSGGKRAVATILGAIQFGVLWLFLSVVLFGWAISLSPSALVLRALPGILIGGVIGYQFPKVALFLGMFSFGDS